MKDFFCRYPGFFFETVMFVPFNILRETELEKLVDCQSCEVFLKKKIGLRLFFLKPIGCYNLSHLMTIMKRIKVFPRIRFYRSNPRSFLKFMPLNYIF